jgi:hypothetical protein
MNKNIKHKSLSNNMRRLFIFFRASLIVLFTTSNIYLISNKLYVASICLSAGISTMWTLNVKDLALSDWKDRIAYILGGVVGTSISLYVLSGIIE